MILARVLGSVVASEKHPDYKGMKVLIVQPIDPTGSPLGRTFLAVDAAQAGPGDCVLVVDEGASARLATGDPSTVTIRTVVCGIVDAVDVHE